MSLVDIEARRKYHRDYAKRNRHKLNSYGKKWRDSQPKQKLKDLWRKKKYGITGEEYQEFITKQHGVCAICGLPETTIFKGKIKELCVDHNHVTGKVRGLLCMNCNVAAGMVKDEPRIAIALARYLEENK